MATFRQDERRPGSQRRWSRPVLRVGGSVLVFSVLLAFVPTGELVSAIRGLSPLVLLPAVGLYLLLHLLGVLKWRLLINTAGAGMTLSHSARCYFAGLFGNMFLVSLVGGDFVRAGLALRRARSRAGLVVGSLLDRLVDVAGLFGIAVAAALTLPGAAGRPAHALLLSLAIGAGVSLLAAGALWSALPARRLPYRYRRKQVRLRRALSALARQPHRVLIALGLAVALQAALVMLNAWLGDGCGLAVPLRVWLFAWPLAKLSATLPVSLGGLGVREVALVALMAPFGAPTAEVVAAGLAFEAVIIAGGLVGGALSLLLAAGSPDVVGAGVMRADGRIPTSGNSRA